jgi:hypothetical protein
MMENKGCKRYAVKCFPRRPHITEPRSSLAFSREFDALFKLGHPCAVPMIGFTRQPKKYGPGLVEKLMANGSLYDVLEGLQSQSALKTRI